MDTGKSADRRFMRTRKIVSTPTVVSSAKKKNAEQVPNIKELLLNEPRLEIIVRRRTKWRRRPPVIFD
jgi:hypothetical protein